MNDQPHRAAVAPVADGSERPLWSVMIPSFNCADHLRVALSSVLSQDPGPEHMQIEVIDDHSTRDDPRGVAAEVGGGRVTYIRQPRNVGHVANFATCLQRSRGHLVHVLHGDDAVREGFYEKMQRSFATEHGVGAAFCRYISVDDRNHWQTICPLEQLQSGVLSGWLEKLAVGQRLQTPCMVVRREVYESLGAFDDRLGLGEDWEMWVRIAAHYPVWYEVEPLALYRVGSASITARAMRTGQNVEDIVRAIDTIHAHLPRQRTDALRAEAREIAATTALRRARRAIDSGQGTVARAQVRSALRVSRSPAVLLALGRTLARLALARARPTPDQAGT
jgi:hypothetical protein